MFDLARHLKVNIEVTLANDYAQFYKNMKKILLFIGLVILGSCAEKSLENKSSASETNLTDFTQYVNPFIGTSKMGHVFPGATAPFGMVQLSPQTNFEVMYTEDGNYNSKTYEYCAGYQYRDSTLIGFSHTNLSGTGHSDLGDFLVMPTTGKLILDPIKTEDGEKGFYSKFSHSM